MSKKQINGILLYVFLAAGTFTFSGGMAMLPLIEKELVKKRNLVTKAEVYDAAALAQTLPGVNAFSTACLIGNKCNGVQGSIIAGTAAVFPAFVFMSLAAILYNYLPKDGPFLLALEGVRATSCTFVFAAALSIGGHKLKGRLSWVIFIISLFAVSIAKIPAPVVLFFAIIFGLFMARRKGGDAHATTNLD